MDPPLSHRPKISGPSTDEHNPAPITRDSPTPPSAAVLYDLESQRVIAATPSADEMNGGNPRRRIPYPEVLANFAIIFVIGFITVELLGWIGPYRRGFFCDDDTIRLPYKSIQTVPVWMLLVYGLGLPAVVLSLGELARMMSPKTADERLSELEHGQQPPMRVLVRFVYFYGHYLIAFAATNIFTAIAKYPVGRLRPHFIDLCKPTIDGSTFEAFCNFTQNWHTYIDIDQYSCEAVSQDLIQEARLSFFSGHSSTAMCASVFVAIYLHARQAPLMRIRLVVLVPLLQIFVLSMGMLIAYSRVQDHMHHSTDVLIGMTTGSSIAAFTAMHIAGLDISAKNRGRFLLVPMRDSSAETGAKTSETTTMTAESMNGVGGGGVGMGTAR